MTAIELLIEALEYEEEDGESWWTVFDSKRAANRILTQASKQNADEHQIAEMLALKEDYIDDSLTEKENYVYILKKLKQEMKEED